MPSEGGLGQHHHPHGEIGNVSLAVGGWKMPLCGVAVVPIVLQSTIALRVLKP